MSSPYRPDMDLECSEDYAPFDDLVDHATGPAFEEAHELVTAMCNRCPIRAACHDANADEDWLRALKVERPTCPRCGTQFTQTRNGPPRRYCSVACRRAAEHVKRKAA